jgi:4-amino-4-deoxy-L-arabinose transferase-like glycosyltransferase
MPSRFEKQKLPSAVYWLALLAFGLRVAARLHSGIADFWVNGYRFFFAMAQNIAEGKGIGIEGAATAFRVPLYPIFLAGLTLGHKAFWPIAIAQSAIGAGTVFCAALLARQIYGGPRAATAATLAAAMAAVYPYYVIHDTALEETSLFTLLTLAAVLLLRRTAETSRMATGALAGVLLGLDVLTRATIAPFALLAPLWLFWQRRMHAGLACAFLLVLTVAPWLIRNDIVMGVPTLSTETGIELWNGNNGYLFQHYPAESSDLSKAEALHALSAEEQRELDRIEDNEELTNRWFLGKAFAYMRAHPGQTAVDGLRKIAAAFDWLPSPRRGRMANLAYALSYGPVMLLGVWGMWRRRGCWRQDAAIYLLFAAFIAVTAVFWAHTSHRAYLDVYWMVFAAGGLAEAWAALAQRGRGPELKS